tara:strand:+ start:210 stop:482 length:273 start_codon:yes stop_codon:yes gene_type:complete
MIPESFRGVNVPPSIKNKTQLVAWALEEFQQSDPITNWEFVTELYCHRFGGVLFNLRKEGYKIVTLPTKKKGLVSYYCTEVPLRKTATIS